MWLWITGLLLPGHAFVHAVWRTYGPKTSWILRSAAAETLSTLSTVLFIAAAVGFGLAGFGVLLQQGWWRAVAVISAVISLLLLGLFWRTNLFVGAATNVAVLLTVFWLHWPQQLFTAR